MNWASIVCLLTALTLLIFAAAAKEMGQGTLGGSLPSQQLRVQSGSTNSRGEGLPGPRLLCLVYLNHSFHSLIHYSIIS